MVPVSKKPWPRVAEKLAELLPAERLHPAVRRWLEEPGHARKRLAVALSGGADSVALLLLLWAHWPARRTRLLALHFDHRLRGPDSAGDARFCAGLCRALGVELVTGHWESPPPQVSEARARTARLEFFQQHLKRRRVGVLCTGHHRDDVAESFFMRLARGSGAAGLSAPRPVHAQPALGRVNLRPLLGLEREELRQALSEAGGRWREDASNLSARHLRNRVRAELVPVWRAVAAEPGRDALAGLALARELLQEDDEALENWAERVDCRDTSGGLVLEPLRDLPRAVLRRVLQRWLAGLGAGGDLKRTGFNSLLDMLIGGRAGARHSLGPAHFVVRERERLVCVPAPGVTKRRRAGGA